MKPTVFTAALALAFAGLMPGAAAADPADLDPTTRLAGHTVFLDPGHQGSGHSENLSRQVDDGRGGTKDCQTTGMTTVNGVPEHTINWNVAQLVKASLSTTRAPRLSSEAFTSWATFQLMEASLESLGA